MLLRLLQTNIVFHYTFKKQYVYNIFYFLLTVSIHAKYDLVDCWMRRDRAIEEISLCKKELANYLRFLGEKELRWKVPLSILKEVADYA